MKARRAEVSVVFDGTDISADIAPYFKSLTYVDNEEDAADDLTVVLADPAKRAGGESAGGIWLRSWAGSAMRMSAQDRRIAAAIRRLDWKRDGDSAQLPCGEFELDTVSFSGFPVVLTMKATSLPFASPIRQTVKSKAWEDYTLSGIAGEIASKAGMTVLYACPEDPHFKREEQYNVSDIRFLATLCHNNGISLKVSDGQIILFSQEYYESKGAVREISFGDEEIESFSLATQEKGTQYSSCSVSYTDPETGEAIQANVNDPEAKTDQVLRLTERVDSVGDALRLAAAKMRYYNKFEKTGTFTMAGNPGLVAGLNVTLSGFGEFSGKYAISRAVHTVGADGYRTQINIRNIITRY